MPMLYQIALGSVLMTGTIVLAGITVWLLELAAERHAPWFRREPRRIKLVLVLRGALVALWSRMEKLTPLPPRQPLWSRI